VEQPQDWTEPGAHPVADGVFRIPLPLPTDGLRAVNVYAIRMPDGGLVMVDGGWALDESRRQFEWALKEIDARLPDITRFLVTHAHRDHYTQAASIRAEYGTKVSLGIGERDSLVAMARPGATHGGPQLARLRRAGARPVMTALLASGFDRPVDMTDWDSPDDWIDGPGPVTDGRRLMALPTPGHTQGHLVFTDVDAGLLFAGDHVLPHITPSIGFEYVTSASPLAAYLDSLATIRELPDLRLLPAHGPVTDSAHRRVDELVAHHAERLDASVAAVTGGASTGYEAAHVLRWTRRGRWLGELDTLNQLLATLETMAHLDLLVAQGRLASSLVDGVSVYSPV